MSCYSCPAKLMTEAIVISGMSGRFPDSDSTDEFAINLYKNVDLITDDSRRWPTGTFGMNHRMGKIKDIDRLDGQFFGILKQLGDTIDPHSRILLETTYEAMIDAGVSPQKFRGTKTGVYIGYSSFGMPDGLPEDVHPDSQNSLAENMLDSQGQAKCLYSNRISFVFDFKGPSQVTDTACSSSLYAFNSAVNDMRLGKCDQAIVGATQVCLQPFTNQTFQSTRVNAFDGISKVWDEKADGYVRGETVCCFLLQRKSEAKRIYATVLNTGVNIDGNKRMGMFFPSAEIQEQLMVSVYKEANVDPLKINYFEAHATGTKAGDTQEAKAIYNAYCLNKNREEPLPIGLLKSIIGHCEGASGGPAVVRVLLAYENECITANLHLENLKNSIKPFCPPLMPVKENMKYNPGIAGVNNFGVGGVNAHALLEPNYKTSTEEDLNIADPIPRLINICARNESAFNELCKWIEDNPKKVSRDFLALLADTMRVEPSLNSTGMPFRGSIIIKQLSDNSYEYKKQYSVFALKQQRPLWVIFPGLGGQWVGMAKALMPIKIFADKIEEYHKILEPFGIDLKRLLLSEDQNSMSTMTNKFCATTAIEIALFDVMMSLGVTPNGIIGHSFGEIAAAYADGCLTAEEALLITYFRGVVTENDKHMPKGLMAVIGISWTEAKKMCGKGVQVVCNNDKELVVISGIESDTKVLVEDFRKKGVFVVELESHGIPYHSQFMMSSADPLTQKIKEILKTPRLRSNKWVSTAIIETNAPEELKYASAEYFVHNLISPVYFYNKLSHIPEDAIVLEIGPHPLFSRVIKDVIKNGDYLSLLKKNSNDTNLDMFLTSIGKLYELGVNPIIENLYPKVEWPVVRGTQSIGSLMKWDHSETFITRKYPDHCFRPTASDMNVTINLSQSFKSVLPDHCIDGNVLYPATGYLMLAWKRMAAFYAKPWKEVPVIFEDVQFRRPIFLSEADVIKIKVKYLNSSGDFTIEESGSVCCYGKIRTIDENILNVQNLIKEHINVNVDDFQVVLTADDIYKDLRILGYDYGIKFRKLKTIKSNNFETYNGEVEWDGNWITFVDCILQSMCLALGFRKMFVPVMIKSLRCDPRLLFEAIKANRVIDEEVEDIDEKEVENKVAMIEHGLTTEEDLENEWEGIDDKAKVEDIVEQIFREEYHLYRSVIPFFVDVNSRLMVTTGLEIEDLLALPIPRKINTQDLKLESYEFIPNEDSNAIEESEQKSVLEYIKVCSMIGKQIKEIDRKGKSDPNKSEELKNKYLIDIKEEHILLKIMDELNNKCLSGDDNNNKYLMSDIIKNIEYDMDLDLINQVSKNERLIRSLLDIVSENYVPKREIRVLEMNSTNNIMAEEIDQHLASFHIYPIDVNYTIALKSTDGLSEEIKKKSFKIIEWKPEDEVFPSEVKVSDLILFRDSSDLWDLSLEKQLQEMFDTIVDKGFLLSAFRYQLTEPEMTINLMNGKTSSDFMNRISEFVSKAESVGFSLIGSKSDTIGWMAMLFKKMMNKPEVPKKENIIKIRSDSVQWFDLIKEKLIQMKESEEKKNIWLIANDSEINGIIGLINCLRLEPGGEYLRCLFICSDSKKTSINFKDNPFSDILFNDLTINVLKNGKLGTYRHLTLPKDYDKTESNEYFLNNNQLRDLSGLHWVDSRSLVTPKTFISMGDINENQVICNVYMAGLNFKDVMIGSGRVTAGPLTLFTDCMLGSDFAGRLLETGERVMGFAVSRCFGTKVNTREDLMTTIPDHWSMSEAVTLLSTYDTVWYGLIERAQLRTGESILIHSGAGGVGQAAINVCQFYKCDIFVTVGNDDKKRYLMEKFNIPENRIFSSRNIQFKYEIKSITKGKGVDIVLNSLTGDKMDASFECVADSGRFVEIGKYELQMNKQLGTIAFLRDISFIGAFIDNQLFFKTNSARNFFKWVHQNSNNGMIKPIDTTIFGTEEAKDAFKYMTTGKHIGKIVIKIRDEENHKLLNNNFSPANKMIVTTKTYFNPNKVYVITGGLGGFGLEMIHWMIFLGARNLVLTSRRGVANDYQKFVLKRLEKMNEKIKYFETKITVSTQPTDTIEGTKKFLQECQELGPIGGVFHLALVLNDSLLENQSIDKFCETIDSKTKCFENLDHLTRNLNINLDYFVVFSSVSCGKGNAGQSNYGYANSICERICEKRRSDGLHGLAIQWGPIGDVGVMADTEVNTTLAAIVKQRVNSCLESLDKLLQTNKSIVSCVIRAQRSQLSGTRESKMVNQLWQALGIDPKTTPNHLTLGEIGMESLFAVELQQGLEREYNVKVTLNDIKNITIGMMKDFEAGKVEELKKFGQEIQEYRTRLSKVKFIIPSDAFTRLNNITTGDPIYFLPPLEGIFASLESLAQKMNRPVIGLNWIRDMDEFSSLKEIGRYYKNLMKTLEPKGNYDIVGYFFGGLIAMKMFKKAPIRRAVIIDLLSNLKVDEESISDEHLMDMILNFITKDIPESVMTKLKRDIQSKPDVPSKLAKVSEELKEFVGKSFTSKDLEEILNKSFKRAKLFSIYRLTMKKKLKQTATNFGKKFMELRGKLLIIRPLDGSESQPVEEIIDNMKETYFLPEKAMEGQLDLETVDASNAENIKSFDIFDSISININNYFA